MTDLLHDDILRELPDDFVRRMRNWSRSLDGSAVSTCSSLWGSVNTGTYEARIPVLMGESEDTDKAIRTLKQSHQEAIAVFWRYQTKTLSWMARATPRMRLWKAGPASFRAWLDQGHEKLQQELARARKAQGERRDGTVALMVRE